MNNELQKMWEKCGFKFYQPVENGAVDVIYPDGSMSLSPSQLALPEPTLDNLFRYCIPAIKRTSELKVVFEYNDVSVSCQLDYIGHISDTNKTKRMYDGLGVSYNFDPAQALLQALQEVFNERL